MNDVLSERRAFAEKVVLVTGASSGIGRAAAIAFAKEGADIVVASRRVVECEEVTREIRSFGGKATFVPTDVSDPASIANLCRVTEELHGRLDCAFNNAGISGEGGKRTADQTLHNWDEVIQVNLRGVWLCMQGEIRMMVKSGGGQIVNTASDVGLVGSSLGIAPYVASKHGVLGLTKSAALEYARDNIRVNAVCPGLTLTEMLKPALLASASFDEYVRMHVPMGRIANAEEVASVALWLCTPSARFITGQAIAVDGGVTAA